MGDVFVFGDFELDTDRFELRRAQRRVEVQPKVLRLLLHLVVQRERAVSSEELMRELWPGTQVETNSLQRAVMGARQALGDGTSIRTVRGHGYQFVPKVELNHCAEILPPGGSLAEDAPGAAVSGMFLGRERILSLLELRLTEALRGHSSCVLLTGDPGVGKTRTAEELQARARRAGAQTWLGRCTDVEGVPAFWPFVQVLRDALRERGAAEMRTLMGRGGSDIAQVVNELRHALPDLPAVPALDTQSARFRLFDSVAMFLQRAAERQPIVIGLDDLHLADPATLQLLTFVLRQLSEARLLIVATSRRYPLVPPPWAALVAADRTHSMELSGFERGELARYLALAAGEQPPEFAVDALFELTAGNPLFVRQVVDSWRVRAPHADWHVLARLPSSHGLGGAIERHISLLSDACRDALRVAAVLGPEFSTGTLARVAEHTPEDVCAYLSEAEASRLIEPLPAQLGRFRFTHGLIREALAQQLTAAERACLHGRAGRALEAEGVGLDYVLLAEVTRHFVRAAPAHDGKRALPYALRAADTALGRLAYEEAAAHLRSALSLAAYEAPDAVRRMTLLCRLGAALARAGDLPAARAALLEALAAAREQGAVDTLFEAASHLASAPETGQVDEPRVAALSCALDAMPEADERHALLQACLAKSLTYSGDRAKRVQLAQAALQRGRQLPDLRLRTEVLTRCHEALVDPEHLQERVALTNELLQLAHAQDDAGALLRASATQIETCIERGDWAAVESAVVCMENLAERVREPYFRWHAKVVRATQAVVGGQLALAETLAREALEHGAPLGAELAYHTYCTQAVGMLMLQGRMAEAEPIARECSLRYPGLPGWRARLGVIDWLSGRHAEAKRVCAQMLERGLDWIRREPFALSGLCSVAELCGWAGDSDAAQLLYRTLLPYAEHHGVTHLGGATYGQTTRYLAILAARMGQLECAEQHARAALASAIAQRSPTFQALSGVLHAQLLLQLQRPELRSEAATRLEHTREIAQRAELRSVDTYCQQLIKYFGLPA